MGKVCVATFYPAPGFKGRTFVRFGFSTEGTWISASAVPTAGFFREATLLLQYLLLRLWITYPSTTSLKHVPQWLCQSLASKFPYANNHVFAMCLHSLCTSVVSMPVSLPCLWANPKRMYVPTYENTGCSFSCVFHVSIIPWPWIVFLCAVWDLPVPGGSVLHGPSALRPHHLHHGPPHHWLW